MSRRDFAPSLKGDRCWSCGSRLAEALELDHWDNDRENNQRENARTLCFACHKDKSDRARQQGWAYARDTDNQSFREYVIWEKRAWGGDGFRKRQDARNQEELRNRERLRLAQADRQQETWTVYETKCSKPRHPHREEYTKTELDAAQGYCIFCPEMASPLKILAEKKVKGTQSRGEPYEVVERKEVARSPELAELFLLAALLRGPRRRSRRRW